MAKCKWCDRSGIFLKVSNKGLCQNCDTIISMDLEIRLKHIEESKHLIMTSNNTDTIVSRFDFLLSTLKEITKYENKGIETISPTATEALKTFTPNDRDTLIIQGLNKEFIILKEGVQLLKTNSGKLNRVQSFNLRVGEYKSKLSNPRLTEEIDKDIELLFNGINNPESTPIAKTNVYKSEDEELEQSLLKWVSDTEKEDNIKHWGVAPAPYERLAILYRKQKNLEKEYSILLRFSKQKHAPGVKPPRLLERLEKVKELLEKGD